MRTISVVALKGGSGKTTLALHLALAAHMRGSNVVLADADPQRSASDALKARGGAGPKFVETAAAKLFTLQESGRRSGLDLIVVDTPCGPENEVSHAIGLSDNVVIVVRPAFFDLAVALRTVETCRRLGRSGKIVINQACPSRWGRESPAVEKALEALQFAATPIARTVVHARALYETALAAGHSVEELGASPAATEMSALWDDLSPLLAGEPERLRA
ncbi:MAG: AAA family ATPase [Caulobacteraceae bacterium]